MQATGEFEDDHGNIVLHSDLQPGATALIYDAIVRVPARSEDIADAESGDRIDSLAARIAALHVTVEILWQ